MATVIQIIGMALPQFKTPMAGQYLKSANINIGSNFGAALITTTREPRDAMKFDSAADAWNFWRQISVTHPVRPDGQPNRPLTAYTAMMMELPDG